MSIYLDLRRCKKDVCEVEALVHTCTHFLLGLVSCGVIFRLFELFYNALSALRIKQIFSWIKKWYNGENSE